MRGWSPPGGEVGLALGQTFDDVLAAAQAGAGWAFACLYEDLAGVVTGYLRLRGAAEPDDVASETFLQAFRDLGAFSGSEEQFRSWVFTIAHRRMLDERRYWSRRPATTTVDDVDAVAPSVPGPEEDLAGWLASDQLRPVLEGLSDLQREVVLLRVVAGLSIQETAAAVGKRPGAVKQLQRRGLLKLKDELSRLGVTP